MRVEVTFNQTGEFSAYVAAENLIKQLGYSSGSMERDSPIGLKKGDFTIAKWRNLSQADKSTLDGRIESNDMRRGPVTVTIFDLPVELKRKLIVAGRLYGAYISFEESGIEAPSEPGLEANIRGLLKFSYKDKARMLYEMASTDDYRSGLEITAMSEEDAAEFVKLLADFQEKLTPFMDRYYRRFNRGLMILQ